MIQAYSEYKDSGIDYLGLIPAGVRSVKLAYIFEKTNAGEVIEKSYWDKGEEVLYTCKRTPMASDFSGFPENKRTTPKDLLLTRNGTPYVHKPIPNSIYSNVVQRITLNRGFDRDYVSYALANSALSLKGYGVSIESLNFEMWKNLEILEFDLDNQRKIIAFLDRETARIDSLIAEKQNFINLLKEKRQALISHVVTKGLDPNVKMKDSGIEWIGEVPGHWSVCRVKQVSSFITSGPRGWSDYLSDDGESVFLQSGDLNNDLGLNLVKANKVSPPKGAEGIRTRLVNGDVVVCITGANTGRVAIAENIHDTVYINQHLSLIRPIGSLVLSDYLGFLLSSEAGQKYYAVSQYGLKEGLSLRNIAETPTVIPPVEEQHKIVEYLSQLLLKYKKLVEETMSSIELLKEHRTALISAVVTGKIDVREQG